MKQGYDIVKRVLNKILNTVARDKKMAITW